jgi:hypothetical protein
MYTRSIIQALVCLCLFGFCQHVFSDEAPPPNTSGGNVKKEIGTDSRNAGAKTLPETEDMLQTGDDWIANGTVKFQMHSGNGPKKAYVLKYFRKNAGDTKWKAGCELICPVRGMGYYLLAENTCATWIKTSKTASQAELTFRLDGMSAKPEENIWAEFRFTILKDSPAVRLELVGKSHPQLTPMIRLWGSIGKALIRDIPDSADPQKYTFDIIDAPALMAKGAAKYDFKLARFCGIYSLQGKNLLSLYNPGKEMQNIRVIHNNKAGGIGQFEIYNDIVFQMDSELPSGELEDAAYLLERNYNMWKELGGKHE